MQRKKLLLDDIYRLPRHELEKLARLLMSEPIYDIAKVVSEKYWAGTFYKDTMFELKEKPNETKQKKQRPTQTRQEEKKTKK